MKLAFSTVACPEWTLEQVAACAQKAGYQGVDLRTFGSGSTRFACDPALTDPLKIRQMLAPTGCEVACISTSIRYDAPITPPLLGHIIGGTPAGVVETAWAVDLAARLEAPLVRVFAYQIPGSESRASAMARIVDRLELAVATARNTGVRLALENGGSFQTAAEVSELLDRVNSPLLGAAYSPALASLAGEDIKGGVNVLGDRLFSVKLKETRGGVPCALGEGDSHARKIVDVLTTAGFTGWAIYEHDRAWLGDGAASGSEDVLVRSARTFFGWVGARETGRAGVHRGEMVVR